MVAKPYIPLFQLPITKLRPHQPNSRGCSRVSCCSCRLQQPNEHLPNVITKTSCVKLVKCLHLHLRTQAESAQALNPSPPSLHRINKQFEKFSNIPATENASINVSSMLLKQARKTAVCTICCGYWLSVTVSFCK